MLSDPFDALLEFQQALDSYRTSSWLGAGLSGGGAYPPLNVFRKGDDIVVVIEVPGVRKADLQIQVKDNTIRIAGTKSVRYGDNVALQSPRAPSRQLRSSGLRSRRDRRGRVTAECRDGMLALFLPRAERDKPKSITVR